MGRGAAEGSEGGGKEECQWPDIPTGVRIALLVP